MLRSCLNLLLICLLFLPSGICVCAATTTHSEEKTVSTSSHDDGLPDSHEDHFPGCPALEPSQQVTRPEVKPQTIVPVHNATLCFWQPIRASEFGFAYPSAAENGFAATPLHILKRVLLV